MYSPAFSSTSSRPSSRQKTNNSPLALMESDAPDSFLPSTPGRPTTPQQSDKQAKFGGLGPFLTSTSRRPSTPQSKLHSHARRPHLFYSPPLINSSTRASCSRRPPFYSPPPINFPTRASSSRRPPPLYSLPLLPTAHQIINQSFVLKKTSSPLLPTAHQILNQSFVLKKTFSLTLPTARPRKSPKTFL